jgi:hypothetical protein
MTINGKLATKEEQKELKYVGIQRIRLQYLKDSKKKMGIALWNVLEPQLKCYAYGPDSGIPTLSVDGLKQKGLI